MSDDMHPFSDDILVASSLAAGNSNELSSNTSYTLEFNHYNTTFA
ncbi:hypothetical protein N836_33560 [Leptolyngbya sp. Heron Island J]|nr:hypothetical protein N836_33560 [Leptolyngbya sp. Heron Island J]